jgi:hypothetical protein
VGGRFSCSTCSLPALLLLYCCFTAALLQAPLRVLWRSESAAARSASFLLLYSFFSAARTAAGLLYSCFTPAFLLLSAIFLLFSCCFTDFSPAALLIFLLLY